MQLVVQQGGAGWPEGESPPRLRPGWVGRWAGLGWPRRKRRRRSRGAAWPDGEPRPPPGAPVLLLLLLLSLAGSGGGQETKAIFVDQRNLAEENLPGNSGSKGNVRAALGELKDPLPQDWLKPLTWVPRGSPFHPAKVEVAFADPGLDTRLRRRWLPKGTGGEAAPPLWERLPIVQPLWAHSRRRRAVFLPHPAPSGTKRLASKAGRAQEDQSRLTSAWLNFREEKDPWKPADLARRTLQKLPGSASVDLGHGRATKRGARPPLPSATTDAGATHKAGCRCPDSQRATVVAEQAEAHPEGLRVPTPRTEEAAWAASALIFLLVLLTLAILYTRLHRKCRRGPSLYWMTSSEEGRETVATVMKHRLFSRPRRPRRPRQPLQPPQLLPASSSSNDDDSAA